MDEFHELIPGRRYAMVPDYDGLLAVMKRYGIFALGGTDGCQCSSFEFRAIHVGISCHKSSGSPKEYGAGVRIYSHHLCSVFMSLIPIANEIVRQLEYDHIEIRLCDYAHDHKGKNGACVYCGADRDAAVDYLCAKCKTGKSPFGDAISDRFKLPQEWTGIIDKVAASPEEP